jgi:pimeloyl-ACP methyl ester carboxylesterase
MTLSYRILGDGPPLVMIHGMGVTYSIWENLVPLLCPHYKLIMVELPGHGESSNPPPGKPYYSASAGEIEELRLRLGIERWSVLSYSLGAWVVQAYLEGYPEQVDRAVFLCPAALARAWSTGMQMLNRVDRRVPALGSWLLSSWRLLYLVRRLGFNGRSHPYAHVWAREIQGQPVAVIKRLLRDLPAHGRREIVPTACPTLFIWGDCDTITARPRALRPVDRVVHGDHSAPLLASEQVAKEVIAFLSAV